MTFKAKTEVPIIMWEKLCFALRMGSFKDIGIYLRELFCFR